jgi:flagellar basal-body rod modification protein FlgD
MPGIASIGQAITASSAQQASTGLADNFDTFLTLLTAQLQNQDPLSPLDSTEFVGQLVQFSGVEQQIAQNKNLESLVAQSEVNSSTAAVSFIGKQAVLSSRTAPLQNGGANWSYALDRSAAEANIVISDQEGKVVFEGTAETDQGLHEFVWDGRDNAGIQLPDGAYNIQVVAKDDAGESFAVATSITGIVTGVDFANGEPALLMGSIRVSFADILSVRQPGAA